MADFENIRFNQEQLRRFADRVNRSASGVPDFSKLAPHDITKLGALAEAFGKLSASVPWDHMAEVGRRDFGGTEQERFEAREAQDLFEALAPEEQELVADWTPRQLFAMKTLLEEKGLLTDPGERKEFGDE